MMAYGAVFTIYFLHLMTDFWSREYPILSKLAQSSWYDILEPLRKQYKNHPKNSLRLAYNSETIG